MNKGFFWAVFFGGVLFILEALVVIQGEGVKWYLIGMGQIMVGVGLTGIFLARKKKEVKGE